MTPIFFDSSSNNHSSYPIDLLREDHLSNHQFLSPNSQASSTSNSLTTHMFLNSAVHDQSGIFDREIQPPQNQQEGDNFGSQVYNDHNVDNDQIIGNNDKKGVGFSSWNTGGINNMNYDPNQMKWMSSKIRVMLKMKKSNNPVTQKSYNSTTRDVTKVEDHKAPTSPMEETDNSSNSTCSNNDIPIRVCSDCNTTKTPLWRSGPRGPKSLCNACGIRQRKARRALMAAAAAENGNINISTDRSIIAPLKVTKTQHKDHKKPSNLHVTKYKKRRYSKQTTTTTTTPPLSPSPSTSPSSSFPARKNCVEEFLVSLSKNLTFYQFFPQDEKEAAILLMALSCGYAHEN